MEQKEHETYVCSISTSLFTTRTVDVCVCVCVVYKDRCADKCAAIKAKVWCVIEGLVIRRPLSLSLAQVSYTYTNMQICFIIADTSLKTTVN